MHENQFQKVFIPFRLIGANDSERRQKEEHAYADAARMFANDLHNFAVAFVVKPEVMKHDVQAQNPFDAGGRTGVHDFFVRVRSFTNGKHWNDE
jgi:hypothetical protein